MVYKNLEIKPTMYAFPHFEEYMLQRVMLKQYGFDQFFGNERLMIEVLREQKKEQSNKR